MNQPRDEKGRFLSFIDDNELSWLDRSLSKVPAIDEAILIGIEIEGFGIVYGGPYDRKPDFLKGIKLAPEVPGKACYALPVKDFGVPEYRDMEEAILWGIETLYKTGAFYAGCLMGQGRTGTYLACLLKAFGISNPIDVVRAKYNNKAVETPEQETFVDNFPADKYYYLIKMLQFDSDLLEG